MSENDTKSHNNHNIHNNNNNNGNSNDRIEWSRSTILGFIEDYRRQRVLWDPNTKGYHIKQTKYEALKALGQKYCTEIRSIRSKIKSLRSSFHREHGKVMNGRRKGIHYQPMWFAYEAIRFILVGDGNNSNNHIDSKNIINNNNNNNSIENTEATLAAAKALTNFVVDSTASSIHHDHRKQNQQNGGNCNGISNSNTTAIKDDIEDDFDGDGDGDGDGGDIDGDDDGNEGEGGDDDDDDTDTEEMKLFISTNTNITNNNSAHNTTATATATSSSTSSTPTLSHQFNSSTNGRNSFTFKTEIDNRAETPNITTDKKSPSLTSYNAIDNHHQLVANTLNCLQNAATIPLEGLDYAAKMAYYFSKGINNCNLPNPLLALTTKIENNNNNHNNNNYNFNQINKNNYKINKINNNNNNSSMALSNGLLGAAGTAFSPSSVHHHQQQQQQFGLTGVATNGSGSVSSNGNSSGAVTVDDGSMARVAAVIAAAKAAAKANNNANVCSLPQSADVIGNAASNSDLDGELQTYCNIRAEDVKTEIIESDTGDLNLSIPDKPRRETPSPSTIYYHNIRNNQLTNNFNNNSNSNNNNNRPTDLSVNTSRKRKALAATRFERYNCNDEAPSPSKQTQQQQNLQQQQQQHSNHLHLKPQITITPAAGRELLTNTTNVSSLIPANLNRQTTSVTLCSTKTSSNNNNNNTNNSNNNNSNSNNNNNISGSNSNINNNNSSSSSSSTSTNNNTNKLLCLNQSKAEQQGVPLPSMLQQQSQVPQQQTDEYGIFGEYVAVTIRKLKTSKAKIVVKHLINNLLYEAELGKYDHGIPSTKEPPQLYKM